jgi:uncharacterized membrane protein YfcA
MQPWEYAILSLAGLLAGFVNVMAGGGSSLTVPIMVFLGLPGPVANGTNRIAILVQNVTAVTAFFKQGLSDFRLSLTLSLCSLPGALAGAWLGTRLEGMWFNRTLAIVMLGLMLAMAFERKPATETLVAGGTPRNLILGHALMVFAGLFGGFIQIGVGFVLMAILRNVMRMNLVVVNMHKVFITMCFSTVALLVFAAAVEIRWLLGALLAVTYSIGAWLGVHLSIHGGERVIKIVLNVVLTLFIIKLLFF